MEKRYWHTIPRAAMAGEVTGFRADGIVGPQTWQALVTGALSG
jgi:peptidoglycan hydrolase-like protein with peptidoglycan-binding domain